MALIGGFFLLILFAWAFIGAVLQILWWKVRHKRVIVPPRTSTARWGIGFIFGGHW